MYAVSTKNVMLNFEVNHNILEYVCGLCSHLYASVT